MATTGTVMPSPVFTGWADDGTPLNGGLLYAYIAGTTTPQDTFTDSDLVTANANPVVLDSRGQAVVYLSAASYKFILKTSAGATVWTRDNVQSTQLTQSLLSDNVDMLGAEDQVVDDQSYPTATTFAACLPGSKIVPIDSGNLSGTYKLRGMIKTSSGTATLGVFDLTTSGTAALRETSSTSTVGTVNTSTDTITFAAAGTTNNYGVKLKVSGSAIYASAWAVELVRVT